MTNVAIASVALTVSVALNEGIQDVGEVISTVKILKNAQKANEARYPSGEMELTLHKGQIDISKLMPDVHETIKAKVRWDGGRVRTDYTRWGPSDREIDMNSPPYEDATCIINENRYIWFGNTGIVVIEPIGDLGVATEYRLTPEEYWYTSQVTTSCSAIDPFDSEKYDLSRSAITAHKIDDTVVKLSRKDNESRSAFDAWFSYNLDGNPLRYELVDLDSGVTNNKEFTWDRDSSGHVYLKASNKEEKLTNSNGNITKLYEIMQVNTFNANLKSHASIFELKSLNLQSGTTVKDLVAGKTYRIGDKEPSSLRGTWEPLIRQMRSRGFASITR